MRFILYDPITGAIVGRLTAEPSQAKNYPNRIEVSDEEYFSKPELFARVNPETKQRVYLTAEEVANKIGRGISKEEAQKKLTEFMDAINAATLDDK